MTTTKTCTKCNKDKGFDEFHLHKLGKNGLNPRCKTCKSEYAKARRKANHASILKMEQAQRDARGDELKEYKRDYRKRNVKAFSAAQKRYRGKSGYSKIIHPLRCRMYKILNGTSKCASTLELLGCTVEHFRFHLEQQFTDGMTWSNYGEWHMDHIIPCASFDQKDPEQQKICWHYTNYQPLWAEDNLRKSDTIIGEHQVKLL
jgi:hypothetical protein